MKKVYGFIMMVALITTFSACKKDKGEEPNNSIYGYWELTESESSMLPKQTYAEGNGNTLVINENSTFTLNGGLSPNGSGGTFTIHDDNTVVQSTCLNIPEGQFTQRIDMNPAPWGSKIFIQVEDGKLSLVSGCFAVDAGVKYTYRRTKLTANW